MIDEICKKHREEFEEEFEVDKLDFLPRKYFEKFVQDSGMDFDHPLLYRNRKYDYFITSLYFGERNNEIIKEGFKEIPSMYNTSCKSYVKRFLNTKTSVIKQ